MLFFLYYLKLEKDNVLICELCIRPDWTFHWPYFAQPCLIDITFKLISEIWDKGDRYQWKLCIKAHHWNVFIFIIFEGLKVIIVSDDMVVVVVVVVVMMMMIMVMLIGKLFFTLLGRQNEFFHLVVGRAIIFCVPPVIMQIIIWEQKSIINFPPKHRAYQIIKKHFKKALKKFLLLGSFYTLDEFYKWSTIS